MIYQRFKPDQKHPDHRFRRILGEDAWLRLPEAVRARFDKRLKGGVSVVYQGEVISMQMNLVGRIIAHVARLVGGPLPYDLSSVNQPSIVTVTEDCAEDGQFWIRQYGRASGFPQVIHSSKRFAGPTGVEEFIGAGIGIALCVNASDSALIFKSDQYFLQLGRRKIRLPKWVRPGALEIAHSDLGDGQFIFSLKLKSRLFGDLIHQDALFRDMEHAL